MLLQQMQHPSEHHVDAAPKLWRIRLRPPVNPYEIANMFDHGLEELLTKLLGSGRRTAHGDYVEDLCEIVAPDLITQSIELGLVTGRHLEQPSRIDPTCFPLFPDFLKAEA